MAGRSGVTRHFERALALIGVGAFGLRCLYAVLNRHHVVQGDALTFHVVASHLAGGSGFIEPFTVPVQPTAEHPPLWEVVLAGADLVGADGYLSHRLLGALIGTVTVVLVGLIARRVAGPRAGLIAAGLAAIYPIFLTADGSLMSETLYGALVAGVLLGVLALRDHPSAWIAAACGVLVALAGLTRGEGLGLLLVLVLPVAVAAGTTPRRRLGLAAAALGACVVVLAPWTIRNAVTFDDPVLISTNSNGVFVGANCPATYHGSLIGSWRFQCYLPRRPGEDEAAYFLRNRRAGLDYARDHSGRIPVVLVHRMARMLDVAHVGQSLFLNAAEGRPVRAMRWAIRSAWVLMLLAVAGAVVLARRRERALWVLLAPVLLVVVTTLVTYGNTRFRQGAEPSIVVLAAVAIDAAVLWWLSRRRPPGTAATPPG